MKKNNKKTKGVYFLLIQSVIILILTVFMGMGYASINSITSEIVGTVTATPQSGVIIMDVTYVSDVNANVSLCTINDIYRNILNSTMVLSSTDGNSSITYQIRVYNNSNIDYAYKATTYDNMTYDNSNIGYTCTINQNEVISSHTYKTFNITFSYKNGLGSNNTLNSYLNFGFGANHTITYEDIEETGLQTNIADGLTYTKTFSDPTEDVEVTMGTTKLTADTDYTYSNGTLTIPNVTGNLNIKGVEATETYARIITSSEKSFTFDMSYFTSLEDLEYNNGEGFGGFTFTNNLGSDLKTVTFQVRLTLRKVSGTSGGNIYIYPTVNFDNTDTNITAASLTTSSTTATQVASQVRSLNVKGKKITDGSTFSIRIETLQQAIL